MRNADVAEDIAIDMFVQLLVHRHRYNFKTSLKTYLYMVGRSRALDYIKHRKTINFVELSEAQTREDDTQALEDILLADQRKRLIHTALLQLPEDMRVVIHLIYFEGMTYQEAAKVMKKKPKQVDNLLYRGKKELRIILGEDGEQLL